MTSKKKPTAKRHRKHPSKSSNYVSGLAVIGLVVLALADIAKGNAVPSFVFYGLIGASLGAKFDDISRWFGGGHS